MRSNSFPGRRPAAALFSLGLLAMLALDGCSREPASVPAAVPAAKDAVSTEPHVHTQYRCPMHPDVVRDAPGQCPICGMDLVEFEPAARPVRRRRRQGPRCAFHRR